MLTFFVLTNLEMILLQKKYLGQIRILWKSLEKTYPSLLGREGSGKGEREILCDGGGLCEEKKY